VLNLSPEQQAFLKVAYDPQKGIAFRQKKIKKHLNFINNAETKDLIKFKNSLCCLAYNFKTGCDISICNK